jgi:SAM-dependent methyltransferase
MADLNEVKLSWDALARLDPLFAILAERGKRGGGWDEVEFFRTGVEEVDFVTKELERLGVTLNKRCALDFWCGVGRITQALAAHFESVVGVDIAPSMIALAGARNLQGSKCSYVALDSGDLSVFHTSSFDFIYSVLVLQHMPVAFAERYIQEFFRVLKSDGVVVFQIPDIGGDVNMLRARARALVPTPLLSFYRSLRYGDSAKIKTETNMLARSRVEQLISDNGGTLVHVDGNHGRRLRYLVKNGPAGCQSST